MALILSIETSTNVCSVAIHDEGRLVVSSEVHIDQSHASKLAVLLDEAKRNAGIELNQLKAIALSSGPGSYTGLRIGTSTAKGLCYALDIPLIAINTLDLLAYQVSKITLDDDTLFCPMIDARRMEVYCQVVNTNLEVISPIEAKIIDESSFVDSLSRSKVIFFGNGADKCRTTITNANAIFLSNIYPAASQLGYMAFQKLQANKVEDLLIFEPLYLKDFMVKKPQST